MADESHLADIESEILDTAGRLAAGLLSEVSFGGSPLSVQPRRARGWMGKLLARLPTGVQYEPAGAALFLGCAWAVAEAARAASERNIRWLDVEHVVDFVTGAPPPSSSLNVDWAGYVPAGETWLSLALGAADHDAWRRLLSTPEGRTRDAQALALLAQRWGLACLPAKFASKRALRASGLEQPPPVGSVQRALDLPPLETLHQVRVLDLGVLVAAPLTCSVLSALGASVTAVAHPSRTSSRWYGPRALALDLYQHNDRREFIRLCRAADVVVDNFSPRVWENFGFEPVEFGCRLHVSLPAFPVGDSRRHCRAYGFQMEALFGVGCSPQVEARQSIAAPRAALMDHAVGLAGAVHCLGALVTGARGRIEVCHAAVAGLVT
jgi:hypothetical protein